MPLALQYSKDGGSTFEPQVDLTSATTGYNNFITVKDSKDNQYILCRVFGEVYGVLRIIKITTNGTVSICNSTTTWAKSGRFSANPILSRDEKALFFLGEIGNSTMRIYTIPLDPFPESITLQIYIDNNIDNSKFAIYQDRYIWVASGSTVKIYDYTSKALLASVNNTEAAISICCGTNNTLYGISFRQVGSSGLCKYIYNDVEKTITKTVIGQHLSYAQQTYTLLIDKWGDIIGIRTYSSNSYLFKWNISGLLLQEMNMSGNYANLNTDKDGNYYYSNALGTYKIAANVAQGQAFTGLGVKIRGNGMTTYGNNLSGYAPAVFGEQ